MTRRNSDEVTLSRREIRRHVKAEQTTGQKAPWTLKRGLLTAFSGVAAVAFLGVSIAPAVGAFATGEPRAFVPTTSTAYNASVDGAQGFVAHEEAVSAEISRGSYTVYVTPTPTPTPEPVVAKSSSGGGSSQSYSIPRYSGGGSPSEWMAAAGISADDSGYVNYIVKRESGWNPNATNSSSGACGLVQAYPCSKVPGGGYDPVANLRWANGYAVGRYGSWANAYNFWTNNHWW